LPSSIDISWLWDGIFQAIGPATQVFLWILPFALIPALIERGFRFLERSRDSKAGLNEIDKMSGKRFEQYLAHFFMNRGYRVELTPDTSDYGVDLILTRSGRKTAVQAKRWKDNVGIDAVREVFSGKTFYKTDDAIVVTNSRYTENAKTLAKSAGVVLWDREKLRAEILKDQRQSSPADKAKTVSGPAPGRHR